MESDCVQWVSVRRKNRDFLKPFEPSWPQGGIDEDYFHRRLSRLARERDLDHTYAFLIFTCEEALIGGININNVSRGAAQFASLGYWLDEQSQGFGYMGEAGMAVLDYAFHALLLDRMNAATLPENEKSKALLKRWGFREEGFAKAYIQIDGIRRDHILFGMNKADFSGTP